MWGCGDAEMPGYGIKIMNLPLCTGKDAGPYKDCGEYKYKD